MGDFPTGTVKEYQVSWLTSLLHSFPHLDLTLQIVNSTFNLENAKYKESLIVWGAVPVLWLLVTLMIFLLYFCYRCCQQDVEKDRRLPCLQWSMAICAFLSCCAVGVGFYGNEDAHRGMQHLVEAAEDAVYIIARMKNQSIQLQRNINDTIAQGVDGMKRSYDNHPEVNVDIRTEMHSHTDQAFRYARDVLHHVFDINRRAGRVDLTAFVRYTREYGVYRWIATLLGLSWLMILCLELFLGIGRSSKCLLLLFCAFGIFSLVLCWLSAGLHLLTSVGVADLCVSPHLFFHGLMSEHIERDVMNYYLKCDINVISNPFKDALQHASDNIKEANVSLNKALTLANIFIPTNELNSPVHDVYHGLGKALETLMHITELAGCTNLHKDYIGAMEGICNIALPGAVLLLLSLGMTGLLFAILVIIASRAWRHFGSTASAKPVQNLKNLASKKFLNSLLKGDKVLNIHQLQKNIKAHQRLPRSPRKHL